MPKRQRSALEEAARPINDMSHAEEIASNPSKKPRKETNASAGRSLFVRSLPATATSDKLTEMFSQNYPLKHATVVIDTETKQSKGYGFVTFTDAEDAQRAMDEFNGHSFQGRKMKIEIAQPRSRETGAKVGAEGKKRSTVSSEAAAFKKTRQEKLAVNYKSPKLIIRNLPWSIKTPEQLAALFQKFGKVKHSTLPKVKDTQAGFGFVVMRGKKNAEKAMTAVNSTMVDGRILAVDWAVEKEVWENNNKPDEDDNSEVGIGEGDDSDAGEPKFENEEDDVANFMKDFGGELESEPESGEDDNYEDDGSNNDGEVDEEDSEVLEDVNDDNEEVEVEVKRPQKVLITDNSSTLFIRNLPFTTLDADLKEHFNNFGPVRYARVVMDRATGRPKGTAFVCFYNVEDADACYRNAPRYQPTGANATKTNEAPKVKHSLLEDENADNTGLYTIEGRVMQVAKAVEKEKAVKLTDEGTNFRDNRDKDKRKLYLLSEGTVAAGTALYNALAPSEVKMREESAMQRKKLIQNDSNLHLSLTRLSLRNLPRNLDSKALKALAREAVVGFATDVKTGLRQQLSKEEEARGGDEMREAEKDRKAKGKGIVRQAKIVFEGREGAKVSEESGAGRSRGYGFVEYSSHRWALMGLRWLNGHSLTSSTGKNQRLIVEFAIENAKVVERRKEKEEKARVRSKEVLAAREKGELPEKGKKVLSKDSVMKKTRVGSKGKKFGNNTEMKRARESKGVTRVQSQDGAAGVKRRVDKKAGNKPEAEHKPKFKPGFPAGEEGRLQRRAQIIQKKRQMRRTRKSSA